MRWCLRMIDLILLAAGSSRRFRASGSGSKLLTLWNGRPMYRTSLERWEEASRGMLDGGRVYVVSREPEILEAAAEYGMVPVFSPESAQGISWSIRNGLCAAGSQTAARTGRQADHYVFAVTDQPMLTAGTMRRFLHQAQTSVYACLSWDGRTGNPVSFPAEAVEELMMLEGDSGGKKVLRRHMEECTMVSAAEAVELKDIDTLEQLREAERESVSSGKQTADGFPPGKI